MRFSLPVTGQTLPIIFLFTTAAALAVTPRSGAGDNGGHGFPLRPLTSATVCPTPLPYAFCYQITEPNDGPNDYYYITGINNAQQVVGAYKSTLGGSYTSFLGKPGSGTNSALTDYTFSDEPNGTYSTYLTGLSSAHTYQVGYAVESGETLGALYSGGNWSTITDPNQATSGTCAVTEVLGIHDSRIAVGFYETNGTGGACVKHAFEVYSPLSEGSFGPQYTFVDLAPTDPSGGTLDVTSSVATGVNILGDVVGTVTWPGSGGTQQTGGWIYRFGKYTTFCLYANGTSSHSCTGAALPTYANAINFSDLVVGNFTNGSSQNGFALVNPWKASVIPEIINVQGATNTTLTGVNQATGPHQDVYFTGWATLAGAAGGRTSGIVGICPKGPCGSSTSGGLPRHRSYRPEGARHD